MAAGNLSDLTSKIKSLVDCRALFKEEFPTNYRETGNCSCAWHTDKTTLSLEVKKDVCRCYGACSANGKHKTYDCFDIVRKSRGLTFPQAHQLLAERCGISVEQVKRPKAAPEATYDYRDQHGALLFQVLRYPPVAPSEDKTFRQRRPDPDCPGEWIWSLGDTPRVLFGLPELLNADPEAPVLIVEGEKDVLAARELGFVATCNPGGAGKWPSLSERWKIHEPLKGRTCWIIPDNDEPGRKHAEDVARSLAGFARSVKIVPLEGIPEKGDLSDFRQIVGDDDRCRQWIEQLAGEAPEYKPPRTGPEFLTARELMEMEIPAPRWIVPGILPEGLSLLVAKPKCGKSWLCINMALAVAQGAPALGKFQCESASTLSLCLEDNKRRMRERLSLMLQDQPAPDSMIVVCEWLPYNKGAVDLLEKTLEERPGIRLVTIDTLGRLLGKRGHNEDIYSADYAALEPLHTLASSRQIGILLLHHERKAASEDILDSVLGSTALAGAADSLLILRRISRLNHDATLHVTGRDLEDAEHALSFKDGLWTYQGDPQDLRLTEERRQIRWILKETGKALGAKQVSELMEPKKSYNTVYQTMSRMVEAGELERAAGQAGKFILRPEDARYDEPQQGNICLNEF